MNFFGNYFLGKQYQEAHLSRIEQSEDIINIMLEWVKKPQNIFYFSGNIGNGKTYFAAAWYHFLKEKNKNVRIFNHVDLNNYLLECSNEKMNWKSELKRICECDYMIIDDVGSSDMSSFRNDVLLELVNNRLNDYLPTLMTSNLARKDCIAKGYDPRTISRIFNPSNVIVEVNGPDRRQEININ
jgi:DNA replication protein DnaC